MGGHSPLDIYLNALYDIEVPTHSKMNESSRVCNTPKLLEELIMDITSHDLNLQMQQLISDYKKTGDEAYKIDAEYLRSEFNTWWNDEESSFVPPAQL